MEAKCLDLWPNGHHKRIQQLSKIEDYLYHFLFRLHLFLSERNLKILHKDPIIHFHLQKVNHEPYIRML